MSSKVNIVFPPHPVKKELTLDDVPVGAFFTAESIGGKNVGLYQRIVGSDGGDLTYKQGILYGRFLEVSEGRAWDVPYHQNIKIVDVEIIVKERS